MSSATNKVKEEDCFLPYPPSPNKQVSDTRAGDLCSHFASNCCLCVFIARDVTRDEIFNAPVHSKRAATAATDDAPGLKVENSHPVPVRIFELPPALCRSFAYVFKFNANLNNLECQLCLKR